MRLTTRWQVAVIAAAGAWLLGGGCGTRNLTAGPPSGSAPGATVAIEDLSSCPGDGNSRDVVGFSPGTFGMDPRLVEYEPGALPDAVATDTGSALDSNVSLIDPDVGEQQTSAWAYRSSSRSVAPMSASPLSNTRVTSAVGR
jgi:hypothetical protein